MTRLPTVLLVDDSLIVLEWVKIVLEGAGLRVLTHSQPMGVGALIVRERPDLVLIDLSMPTLEGDEVVRVARKSDAVSNTQLILHSSRPAAQLEKIAQACGADGFLEKTLDENTLIRAVKGFLERGRVRPVPHAQPPTVMPQAPSRLPVPRPAFIPPITPMQSALPAASSLGPRNSLLPRPLFIDDDHRILEGYRRVFGAHMRGQYTSSVAEAMAQLESSDPPDIVVCDLVMPEMSGVEFYEAAIRLNPQWRNRFVFVTGSTFAGIADGVGSASTPVLNKPVDPNTLSGLIRVLRPYSV